MPGAGYEGQLPQLTDAQIGIDPNDPQDRLRNAFAQMLLAGQGQASPLEALWAAQGRSQIPAPAQTARWDLPLGQPGDYAVMPQRSMNPPGMSFPTAPAGADSQLQSINPPPSMPRVPDAPPRPAPPFPGAASVETKPYDPRAAAEPLPPSGGFADTVSPNQPQPNANASNRAIQPGAKSYSLPPSAHKQNRKKGKD
jgi:hypothetical protein